MIYADRRELQNPGGKEICAKLGDPPIGEFPSDYLLEHQGHKTGIERKLCSGVLQDLGSGRLMQQLRTMKAAFDESYLVVEGLLTASDDGKVLAQSGNPKLSHRDGTGVWINLRRTQWHYSSVVGFLTSIVPGLVKGVHYTVNPAETALVIKELDGFYEKRRTHTGVD